MFGLTLRKWFYDMWDNMFYGLFLNAMFGLLLMIPVGLPGVLAATSAPLALVVLITGILIVYLYVGIMNHYCYGFTQGENFSLKNLGRHLTSSFPYALLLGGMTTLLTMIGVITLPFYAGFDDWTATLALGVMLWILVTIALVMQYWLPFQAASEKNIGKLFKKSFIMFIDNPGYTIGVGLWTLVITGMPFVLLAIFLQYSILLGMTVLMISIFPGITGMLTWHHVAREVRMYKYDYLEAHPDLKGKNIPWNEVLDELRERVGKRTLKNLIMPWKS